MAVEGTCPHYGQRMLIRYGERLTPKQADIFDLIENSGNRGVAPEALGWVFFPHNAVNAGKRAVAVHIHDINSMLVSTDVRIRFIDGFYRVVHDASFPYDVDCSRFRRGSYVRNEP